MPSFASFAITLVGLPLVYTMVTTRHEQLLRAHPLPPPPPLRLPRLVLLDRDGVINNDVGVPGILDSSQIYPTWRAAQAIVMLREAGCWVAVVTNQSCVGKGLITSDGLDKIHDVLRQRLAESLPSKEKRHAGKMNFTPSSSTSSFWDRIYVCTSVDPTDDRRKPNNGMILEACRDFGVDASEAVLVGDTWRDLQAAARGGVPLRILVSTGYGRSLMEDTEEERIRVSTVESLSLPEKRNYGKIPPCVQLVGKAFISKNELVQDVCPFYYSNDLFDAARWLLSGVQSNE